MKHWPFEVVNVSGKPKLEVEYKNEKKIFTSEEVSSMVPIVTRKALYLKFPCKTRNLIVLVPRNYTAQEVWMHEYQKNAKFSALKLDFMCLLLSSEKRRCGGGRRYTYIYN